MFYLKPRLVMTLIFVKYKGEDRWICEEEAPTGKKKSKAKLLKNTGKQITSTIRSIHTSQNPLKLQWVGTQRKDREDFRDCEQSTAKYSNRALKESKKWNGDESMQQQKTEQQDIVEGWSGLTEAH